MPEAENEASKWASLLKKLKFFEVFAIEELTDLLHHGVVKRFEMHKHVFREGDEAKSFYVIIKGRVNVTKKDHFESNKILSVLHEGDCFGELAFLLDVKRQANIIPIVDSFIFRINAEELERLEESFRGKFYKQLSVALAQKLKDFNITALHSLY